MIISSESIPVTFKLSNGIRLIHKQCLGTVSCCGFAINAGTRHELINEHGIAHFTEHMLFKGTTHRRPFQILNRMETVGGELNAYTTKEETFVYSVFLQEDYERAIELLCDLVFYSTFPSEEINKERKVILDEIDSYEDSPSDLIFDDFEDLLYAGHPIGRNILGNPACLKTFNNKSFSDFYARNYTMDRIVFFSQSAMDPKKLKRLIEKHIGNIPSRIRTNILPNEKPIAQHGVQKTLFKETHQAHVIYGNKSFSLFEKERYGMFLLNNILGGPGMNSRLNIALREHSGLVYSAESNVTSYSDTGLFSIYFGTDLKQIDPCMKIVEKELKKLCESKLTIAQWHAAKKQLYGQMMISSENKESQTLDMGKSMLHFNKYDSMQEVVRKIESFTPQSLLEIANKVLDSNAMSLLVYK
jgi:predicted Zn-dependent peptidase